MVGSTELLNRGKPTVNGTNLASDSPEISKREAFAGWPMVIGWLAMLTFAFHACTHMVAAGDTWVALACGRHFVNHGVDTVEPFSFNSRKAGPTQEEVKTWPAWAQWITNKVGLDMVKKIHPTGSISQHWLTQVIFYKLTTMFGSEDEPYFDVLVYWKFAIYVLVVACLYFTSRLLGANRGIAVAFACAAMFVGRSFLDIRPAAFTNLMLCALLLTLALTSYRNIRYIWLSVPILVFWSNVHAGYVYGFVILVLFVAWHLLMKLPNRWTIAAYGILTWTVLFVLTHRFLRIAALNSQTVSVQSDWALYAFVLASITFVNLARNRRISERALICLGAAISLVLFAVYLVFRFCPQISFPLSEQEGQLVARTARSATLTYVGIFSFSMFMGAAVVSLGDRVVRVTSRKAMPHMIAACLSAFVAMLIVNPFHVANVTETLRILIGPRNDWWRTMAEWDRAFDGSGRFGATLPFTIVYVFAWICLAAWVFILIWPRVVSRHQTASGKRIAPVTEKWPKVDVALLAIAAMTLYMAVQSRRFIPMAAYAACPILAFLANHIICGVAAAVSVRRSGRWRVPSMPAAVQWVVTLASTAVVLVAATFWIMKFKRIYLGAWPDDTISTSIFMRMTASGGKPSGACRFIRDNKLKGNLFDDWTDGGAIAWGQTPDPTTGRIPLQMFIDGRGQMAYDDRTFRSYTEIMSGGPVATNAQKTRAVLQSDDYAQIGKWISDELRKYGAWIVLVPSNRFDTPFRYGMEASSNWRLVFLDETQRLYVDITTDDGRRLFQDLFSGKVIYEKEPSACLALGHNLLLSTLPEQRKRGLDLIIRVFNLDCSPAPMMEMLMAAQYCPELQARVDRLCQEFATEFEKNKREHAGRDGYLLRLATARLCLTRLEETARSQGKLSVARSYADQANRYVTERTRILEARRW